MSATLDRAQTLQEVEQFLYREARLLDGGRYDEWLDLLAPDITYRMPTRPERLVDPDDEVPARRADLFYLDEGYEQLRIRAAKLTSGMLQSEVPRSRTVRIIANIEIDPDADLAPDEVAVHSAMLLYRHHKEREIEILTARRHDTLRPGGGDGSWRLVSREILVAANVLPTKNLALFL